MSPSSILSARSRCSQLYCSCERPSLWPHSRSLWGLTSKPSPATACCSCPRLSGSKPCHQTLNGEGGEADCTEFWVHWGATVVSSTQSCGRLKRSKSVVGFMYSCRSNSLLLEIGSSSSGAVIIFLMLLVKCVCTAAALRPGRSFAISSHCVSKTLYPRMKVTSSSMVHLGS